MNRQRRGRIVLLLACLLAAVAAQYYFGQLRDRFWDGVVLYAVAVFCLILLLPRRAASEGEEVVPIWTRAWRALYAHPGRGWALALAFLGLYTSIRLNEGAQNWQAVLVWLVGVGASLAAWVGLRQEGLDAEHQPGTAAAADSVPPPAGRRGIDKLAAWFSGKRAVLPWETVAVAGCTLAALLLRLVRLGTIPYVISGDEASMGIEALHVLGGSLTDPFATGWLSHPTLYFFLMAGPLAVLGRNAWGLRLLSPLAGAATIPVLYLLARRLFDRRVALAGTVMLAAAHLHIHFSRLGINNVYDPLFGLLTFFFLVRGLQEGRLLDFALSGFSLALAQFFYMGARLFPVMLVLYLSLWLLLRPARIRSLWAPAGAFLSSFLVTGGPLFRFFLLHFDDFMARLRIVGIIQSGWLETEPLVTGKTQLHLLWDQFRKSFLAFNYTLDPTSWYAAKIPYLDFVSGILFIIGLVVLLRNWRRPAYLMLNVWYWLALLFGGVLIENPPSSPRFVIFMPAVCLIAALGLVQVVDLLAGLLSLSRAWVSRVIAVVLLAAVVLNVGYYFFVYTPAGDFGGLNTEVGMRIGEYLREQEPGSHVYFFGPPRMWIGYATIPFLAPGHELVDIEPPLTRPPAVVPPSGDLFFIFLPERVRELDLVTQGIPEGQRREVLGHTGQVLFVVYEVKR